MKEPLQLSIWISWLWAKASHHQILIFGWKVLGVCGVDKRANPMLERSSCPGDVKRSNVSPVELDARRRSILLGWRSGTWKHLIWEVPECHFDVHPTEKDLPFCLVLHHIWGGLAVTFPTTRTLGSLHVCTCSSFCSHSFPLRASLTAHLTDGYWRAALAHLKSFDSNSKFTAQARSEFKLEFIAINSFL